MNCLYMFISTWGVFLVTSTSEVSCNSEVYDGPYRCSCETDSYLETNTSHISLSKLQCCAGTVDCKRHKNLEIPESTGSLLCFSETSCVLTDKKLLVDSSCSNYSNKCLHKPFNVYNISNIVGQTSSYQCIFAHNITDYICLLPLCDSFAVVERFCTYNMSRPNSFTCYGPSELTRAAISEPAFTACFLSFADDYRSLRNSGLSVMRLVLILFFTLLVLGCTVAVLKYAKVFHECFRYFWHRWRSGEREENCTVPVVKIPDLKPASVQKSNDDLPTYEEATRNQENRQNGQVVYTISGPTL